LPSIRPASAVPSVIVSGRHLVRVGQVVLRPGRIDDAGLGMEPLEPVVQPHVDAGGLQQLRLLRRDDQVSGVQQPGQVTVGNEQRGPSF
jgi:hypothetical protein